MTTVTSKTTRAELLAMLQAQEAASEALKQDVVKHALTAARRFGYCTEVEKS